MPTDGVVHVSSNNAVELKGGMYTFLSLRLHTNDLDVIDAQLADKVNQAPAFFKGTPVVVDLSLLDEREETLDGAALIACIRRHRLDPIVASLGDKSSPLAESIALPLIEGSARRRGADEDEPASARGEAGGDGTDGAGTPERRSLISGNGRANASGGPNGGTDGGPNGGLGGSSGGGAGNGRGDGPAGRARAAELPLSREVEYVIKAPLLVDRPVRSGQQVYTRDTDLIVMGQVGPGAEVIADNNIHVYGPLRGRALCGVSGNAGTRIFCQSLEAELVSVAGNYRMLETIPESLRGRPAQIWLEDDRLNIEPL